jgi:predicted transcriptional regulator
MNTMYTMCSERYKNGLSADQVQKAKDLFKTVNLKQICHVANVKPSAIYNILRDSDNRLELLHLVIEKALAERKRREELANSLPL